MNDAGVDETDVQAQVYLMHQALWEICYDTWVSGRVNDAQMLLHLE